MEAILGKLTALQERFRTIDLGHIPVSLWQWLLDLNQLIRNLGVTSQMEEHERQKLFIFNQLNVLQLLSGVLVPILGMLHADKLPRSAWLSACVPSLISCVVLLFNYFRRYTTAQLIYFLLYPFFTSFVYLKGMNAGIELHFILYGVLAVFFLQDIGYMVFAIALSMLNYFVLSVVLKNFVHELKNENVLLYYLNHVLALGFIFYGLYLIKKENSSYQLNLLSKQKTLHEKNLRISKQSETIIEKAELLEMQKQELTELNSLKTKLFTVIAHDLKSPMYALRNMFRNIHQQNVPDEDVRAIVPEVLMDLNYTIGLMENLLSWSKTQMQSASVKPEQLEMRRMILDVVSLLRLQAEAKQIDVVNTQQDEMYVLGDRDMIQLVLRNLLSNAIKFTPQHGEIKIGTTSFQGFAEVYVEDSGSGISPENLQKINNNNFYTTKGTSSESGTGLGLMLCREFLGKNKGQLHIESELGKGSVFSFTLPK